VGNVTTTLSSYQETTVKSRILASQFPPKDSQFPPPTPQLRSFAVATGSPLAGWDADARQVVSLIPH